MRTVGTEDTYTPATGMFSFFLTSEEAELPGVASSGSASLSYIMFVSLPVPPPPPPPQLWFRLFHSLQYFATALSIALHFLFFCIHTEAELKDELQELQKVRILHDILTANKYV